MTSGSTATPGSTAGATGVDVHEVLCDRGPFAGATIAQLALMRSALCGRPVRIYTRADHLARRPAEVGIFESVSLPGDRHMFVSLAGAPLDVAVRVGSPRVESLRPDAWDRTWWGGLTRHVGIGAFLRFEVVGPELGFCSECCSWVPQSRLIDLTDYGFEDELRASDPGYVHYRRVVCRRFDDYGCGG